MQTVTRMSDLPSSVKNQARQAFMRDDPNTYAYSEGLESYLYSWLTSPHGAQWLASQGYQFVNPTTGASIGTANSNATTNASTTTTPSSLVEGAPVTVNGNSRWLVKDDYGHWYAATSYKLGDEAGNFAAIDYLYDNGNYIYVRPQKDSSGNFTGAFISPFDTTKTDKVWDMAGGWVDDTSSNMWGNIDPNAPLTPEAQANLENTQAQTAYTQAQTQQLLSTINSPTTSNDEKNAAAVQLYGILTNYANQNNSNAVSQWGNQAGAFNTAYQNAIAQNDQLRQMSTDPLNTVAYFNLIRGQNPPNWQIPAYQKMPDAFTGWNQAQPTTQGLPDTATIQSILAGLGWGAQTTTPTGWANGVVDPNQNDYATARAAYPQYTEQQLNTSFSPITPDQQAASQASYSETIPSARQQNETYQQWWSRLNPTQTPGNVSGSSIIQQPTQAQVSQPNSAKLTQLQQQIAATQSSLAKIPTSSPTYSAYTAQLKNLQTAYKSLGGV